MRKKFFLIASFPDSLLNFRGPFLLALLAEGLEVHVAAPGLPANSQVRQKLENLGVQVHNIMLNRTGFNPLVDLATIYHLWSLMRRLKPDYFLGYTIKPIVYGGIAAWLTRIPSRHSLITGLGYFFIKSHDRSSILKQVVHVLYKISLAKSHKIFFQNPDDEELFFSLRILKKSDAKTVVINGSGINIENFDVALFPTSLRFLMIARLLGDKGVREYVAAAKIVRKQYPTIKFGLVGSIDDNPDAISGPELEEMQKAGDVDFYGYLKDVKDAIAESSVYVLPSYREGTPRSVLEAMAMGRPIITTDVPGCRETVINGENGFLVSVKSVEQLVSAMMRFIDSPGLIETMGKRSRQIVVEKYDVHKINSIMLREMDIS